MTRPARTITHIILGALILAAALLLLIYALDAGAQEVWYLR